jgi:hypothetical protein
MGEAIMAHERLTELLQVVEDVPRYRYELAAQLLRGSLEYPPDRFMVLVLGRLRGTWTVLGPFVGWTREDAESEALAAAMDFTDVHLVGPARVDELREILIRS